MDGRWNISRVVGRKGMQGVYSPPSDMIDAFFFIISRHILSDRSQTLLPRHRHLLLETFNFDDQSKSHSNLFEYRTLALP